MHCRRITMKKIFIILATCFVNQLGAQTTDTDLFQRNQSRNYVLHLLRQQQSTSTQRRPTGTTQRVIAQTTNRPTSWDSIAFKYSGTNGSEFNYNAFTYNEVLNTGWFPSFVPPYRLQPLDVLADTIVQMEAGVLSNKDYGIYRPDHQLSFIQSEMGAWAMPNDRYRVVIGYGLNNKPAAYFMSSYSSTSTPDTSTVIKLTYNNSGKVTIDSTWIKGNASWTLEGVCRYYFDAGEKLITDTLFSTALPGFMPSRVTIYDYYADGKLANMTATFYDQNGPITKTVDTLGYTTSIPYSTFWEHRWTYFSSGNTVINREIRYPNATSGLPDSARTLIASSSSQTERILRYEYNSFQNPEKITIFNSGSPNSNPYDVRRFYYETYDDGVGITEKQNEKNIDVYPNPFTNEILIRSGFTASIQANATLSDITGKVVFSKNIRITSGSNVISAPNLSPGLYILSVAGPNGLAYRKKLIRK